MANIDYQQAKTEIKKLFINKDNSFRKIIFWYDAPSNFKEDILNDNFDFCRLLLCDKNEFAIKKIIEHDDTDSNILVYIPYEKPNDTDNWLLDILMYSEEYYADTVALTMRRLNLINTDLRKIIEKHAKFFDSEARSKKLESYVEIRDDMRAEDFKTGMMSVLVKSAVRSIESVLTELVFDDSEKTKYKELKKFGFEDYLWEEIFKAYNYEGDQKIEVLIKRFMFTAMIEQRAEFENFPSFYNQFIISGPGKMDAKFFVDKIKKDKRYDSLQLTLSTELKIEGLLTSRDIRCIQTADIFECIDDYIIKEIAESLRNGSLDYSTFKKIIGQRINSIFYEKHIEEYQLLLSAISFLRLIEKPIPSDLKAEDYIKNYTDTYYRIDMDYRHFCTNFKKIENPNTEIESLMHRLELLYQDKFLSILGKEFSNAVSKQKRWEFKGIESTKNFYNIIQKYPYKKLFVIISDAMRYEVGHEILNVIKTDSVLKGNAEISCAFSPLPSDTRFGMASLLPHKNIEYLKKSVSVDGLPTNSIPSRNAVLQAKNEKYAAITFQQINNFSRSDLRSFMADKSLVYIYHNTIDNAGEHNENKVFDAVQTAIEEILALVKKLYNSIQVSNFYITADHGFLYRSNIIYECEKYSNIVSLKPLELSKRFIISDDLSLNIPYTTEFMTDDINANEYKVITPYGYDLFKTQGGGIQYVHGGSSLQETLVPIIHISELRSNKLKDAIGPVGVRLKSTVRKITNRSFTLDFEQYEKVEDKKQAITCETYIEDENGKKVSGEYKFIASSSSDNPETRVTKIRFTLKNIEFDRNRRYFLILCNEDKQDEYIEKEQFVIDILGFKVL